ncbi:NAD(P)-binding protein [Polymorphobacter fuscus]|uniref:Tryptophan 2-monooxygenase n=2 Tax=Sandarakinorhabdus fusca TaxID=1439888 RepID=A0A7C9KYC7_9SPHN|nr:flavin monoamine oxidase family protein [Polymorphobacter fuscus]MQT18186.1 NAD(P)-binding protein [Polymorphobacter fuscus]
MDMAGGMPTRRDMLHAIGVLGGASVLYQAMEAMGHAAESQFAGPPNLSGARPGASVVVLGAGLAGMLAAYELRKAGYTVEIIEYNTRPGGRNWSLYGGDSYTELGGATQKVGFAKGNYLNPGPWRIPYHHRTVLHYCKAFGVALEPFIQLNHAALIHNSKAFGGKAQSYRELAADWDGNVAELLSKAIDNKGLNGVVTAEDGDRLKEALRTWGMLDKDMRYVRGEHSAERRGWDRPPGGGINGAPIPSTPFDFSEVRKSGVWRAFAQHMGHERQTTMFQPVGGMGMIGQAFGKQVEGLVRYGAKVTRIDQSGGAVTVTYTDVASGTQRIAKADYCVCTIPLGILSQIELDASAGLRAAVAAVPYSNSVKVGLEMKTRFWEDESAIYGGISFTDKPISMISYPSGGMTSSGPAVILGAYTFGPASYKFAGMTPEQRVAEALEQGSVFHPGRYKEEFSNGTAVAWSRSPFTLGCCAQWNEDTRKEHYQTLVAVDDRIVLAGEHASYIGCWMEGALLSSLDAITRLHKRALEA